MLRNAATRSLLKSFPKPTTSRASFTAASAQFRNVTPRQLTPLSRPQILLLARPNTTTLYSTNFDKIDPKAEKKVADKVLEPHPEEISGASSVRPVFEGRSNHEDGEDMMAGIKADLKTIKETFTLSDVPRDTLLLGAAGVIPYAATSLSTVYLAWDINQSHATHGRGVLFSPEQATQYLEMITPLQIGWGAIIISFLGAIHWGLEYAGYGGYHSYRRYVYGVAAPAIAWPTIFMPVEYALITQFLAFNFMYFADARATAKGWFPAWYGTYRFVLTFCVGASIVFTLVGRGQIVSAEHTTLRTAVDYLKEDRDAQWEALEREEKERRARAASEEDDDDEEEEEEEDKTTGSEDEDED